LHIRLYQLILIDKLVYPIDIFIKYDHNYRNMSNKVYLDFYIDQKSTEKFIENFMIALSSPYKHVEIHINSPGGLVDESEKICHTINNGVVVEY
jgi:ATP-dependent protease ClpP protease subunit